MTKKELKTGMVVKARNGYTYTVMLGAHDIRNDADVLANHEGGYMWLKDYADDLTMVDGNYKYDIVEVYEGTAFGCLMRFTDCPTSFKLLWKRTAEHTPVVGDVYDNCGDKFVITHGDCVGFSVMHKDGGIEYITKYALKNSKSKFTGKNIKRAVDILTNEVKDC